MNSVKLFFSEDQIFETDKIDFLTNAFFFRQSVMKILNISKISNILFGILEIPQ